MSQWTPLRHAHAIGAWPVSQVPARGVRDRWPQFYDSHVFISRRASRVAQASQSCRQIHSSPQRRKKDPEHELLEELPEEDKQILDDELGARPGWTHRRKDGGPDLPLPPFMRPAPSLRDKVRASQERRHNLRKEEEMNYSGVYTAHNVKTLRENTKASPFSTAFALNPYAHALAMPVRQDNFTRSRLPRSCLISLNLFETPTADPDKPEVSFYPASLAAGMISKKKPPSRMTDSEKEIQNTAEEDLDFVRQPTSSSYVLAKREAFDFISKQPKSRHSAFATSRRLHGYIGRTYPDGVPIRWPEDTPAIVLQHLQSNVLKRLAYFLRNKKNPDKPGAIQSLPGNAGLTRLDDISNVLCVLRLKPFTADSDQDAHNPPIDANDETNKTAGISHTTETVPVSKTSIEDTAEAFSLAQQPVDDSSRTASEDWLNVEQPNNPRIRAASTTHVRKMAWWRKNEDFLRDLSPLPPPTRPSTTYYPTVRYRNCRIPMYNLPYLLGEEAAQNAAKDTVFADSEFVTVSSSGATVTFQVWLLQLAAYVATNKQDTPWG